MPHDLLKLRDTEYMHLLMPGRTASNTIMCSTGLVYLPAQRTIRAQHPKMKLITFSVTTLIFYNLRMGISWMMLHGHKKQIIGP